MSEHFIQLTCASCGGKLDVYDDMERLACGYCGTGMIIRRRGGTVSLTAVTEAIRQVQVGTDKTAAELALARHENEIKELFAQRRALQKSQREAVLGLGFGALTVLIGATMLITSRGDTGGIVTFFGVTLMVVGLAFQKRTQLAEIDPKIDQVQQLIAEKKRLADS